MDSKDILVIAPTKLQVTKGEIRALTHMKMQQIQFLKAQNTPALLAAAPYNNSGNTSLTQMQVQLQA